MRMKLFEATEREHILRALREDLPTHDAGQCVQCLAARHPRGTRFILGSITSICMTLIGQAPHWPAPNVVCVAAGPGPDHHQGVNPLCGKICVDKLPVLVSNLTVPVAGYAAIPDCNLYNL